MRLVTYSAASRRAQGKDAAREVALARRICAEKGMQIGLDGVQLLGGHGFVKEHPVERWYRDLQSNRTDGRRGDGLSDQPRGTEEVRPLIGQRPPGRDEHAAADLPEVRRAGARVPQGARHARRDDRRPQRVRRDQGAGASGVRPRRGVAGDERHQERHQPRVRALDHGDVLGRRRAAAVDAAPGAGQLRDRVGRQRRAGRALQGRVGRRWRSPSRRSAPTPPASAPPRSRTATSTSSTARRSTSPRATAPTRSWSGRRWTGRWGARRSSRSWSRRTRPA